VIVGVIDTGVADGGLTSAPGTVAQVRSASAELIRLAKQRGFVLMLVGHVTKDGQIAGPRVLEHMVDTVLYFEGERGHQFRILRSVKNRFGATDEIGVFEMTDGGLSEVANHERPMPDNYITKDGFGVTKAFARALAAVAARHAGNLNDDDVTVLTFQRCIALTTIEEAAAVLGPGRDLQRELRVAVGRRLGGDPQQINPINPAERAANISLSIRGA